MIPQARLRTKKHRDAWRQLHALDGKVSLWSLTPRSVQLWRPHGWIGKKIAKITGQPYGHASWTYAPGLLVESAESGVRAISAQKLRECAGLIEVWEYPPELSLEQTEGMRQYVLDHLHEPFPIDELARLGVLFRLDKAFPGIRKKARLHGRYHLCSVFVSKIFREAKDGQHIEGIDLAPEYDESVESPGDIAAGGMLEYRGVLAVGDAGAWIKGADADIKALSRSLRP